MSTLKGSCVCGATGWTFEGDPGHVTCCNCTSCRRRGTLMIYDYENERVAMSGPQASYVRSDLVGEEPSLETVFCATCACVLGWRALTAGADGRRRMAVNIRLADPATTAALPIKFFDGLDTWTDQHRDGHCVRDLWY